MKIRKSSFTGIHCLVISLLAVGLCLSCSGRSAQKAGWEQVPGILRQIVPPVFPDQDFVITAYGAAGDGQTDCTEAFRASIHACHEAGGGRVVVPAGDFLTGAIHLKSNVNLHLDEKATILFSQDQKKYLPVVFTRFEGVEMMNYSPFIYAFEQENIAITGKGVIDGQAGTDVWWNWTGRPDHGWKKEKPHQRSDRDSLFAMAERGIPPENRIFGEGHYLRVNFVQFYRCKNILIDGITIHRSPMWEIHPVLCENVTVQNVHIDSHGPNNDGCNPESSKNVLIKNCYFNTGDDCIAIKSGRNGDGRRIDMPSENIIIQNCQMKDGHGGVVIGSEISGSCRNVFAEDCVMDSPNLERALRIKTNSLRGGVVENIFMRNVEIGEVRDAVLRIYFHYERGDVGEFTPAVHNVIMQNVNSKKSRYALMLDGYERSPISDILIENCKFDGVRDGNILNHTKNLTFKNVYINGQLQ
ncbi:glycoside hydrolase family 28 protein [bacterium]|nr:glycoside hydrolase family 28 protein [bacterium]